MILPLQSSVKSAEQGLAQMHRKNLCCIIMLMPTQTSIENQLKEASQLTGTLWAALVEREAGKWRVLANYHLAKKNTSLISQVLKQGGG